MRSIRAALLALLLGVSAVDAALGQQGSEVDAPFAAAPGDNPFLLTDIIFGSVLAILGMALCAGIAVLAGWRITGSIRDIPVYVLIATPALVVGYGFLFGWDSTVLILLLLVLLATLATALVLVGSPGKAARHERAQALLRACTGMDEITFAQASTEDRRNAIVDFFTEAEQPVSFTSRFRKNQRYIGMMKDPLRVGGVKDFTLTRMVISMDQDARFLAAAALLYNEGLISDGAFDIRALSLLYQDGAVQLTKWKGLEGFADMPDVRNIHDAFGWVMRNRYQQSQSAKESLRAELFSAEQAHPDNEGVEQARAMLS